MWEFVGDGESGGDELNCWRWQEWRRRQSLVHVSRFADVNTQGRTQGAKVLKTVDGIVSAEVLSCWINPNWQAPLVH